MAEAAQPATANADPLSSLIERFTGTTPATLKRQRHTARQPAKPRSNRTSLVIGLDRKAQFHVFTLSNPNRVIVDLSDTRLGVPVLPRGKSIGVVKSLRFGKSSPDAKRVIINVRAPVIVEKATMRKSRKSRGRHELVLDIVPLGDVLKTARKKAKKRRPSWLSSSAGMSRLGGSNLQPPTPKRALSFKQRQAKISKPMIVIDPGHGGHDSGARKNGVTEKHVVLAFALVLRKRLLATGRYRVRMTRSTDVFIPLDDRVKFAERHNAQLFIAIHADYAGSSARGATVYSLRQSAARALRRRQAKPDPKEILSSKEQRDIKRKALGNVAVIKNMLADLASYERYANYDRTRSFSKNVVRYMGKATHFIGKPSREAGFRVLKTAKLPSVLIELAFVTNRRDARLLKSAKWRRKVAGSITAAVDNYFSSQIARMPILAAN